MHLDPALPVVVGVVLVVLALTALTRKLKQPSVIGYLLTGVALGPHALGLVTDLVMVERLGSFGVVLLLFFIGMEVSPRQLVRNWRVPIVGTLSSIAACVGIAALVGRSYGWPLPRILLIGFVISLSSTAVVLKVLAENGELSTRVGQNVLGVLLVQDVAVVPMMITIGLFAGDALDGVALTLQLTGGLFLVGLFVVLVRQDTITLPLPNFVKQDPEMQVFAALALMCTLALLAGLAHLSAPLGAFAAGLLVGGAKESHWVHHSLEPFRVVFVSLFFVSVGLSVDLDFMQTSALQVGLLVAAAITINTVVMLLIARVLGETWRESIYSGLILSQVGEFGFLLAAAGASSGIIGPDGQQLAIAVISTSLLVSPLLIAIGRRTLARRP